MKEERALIGNSIFMIVIFCFFRGIVFPDFRYGEVSIVIIQFLFPISISFMCVWYWGTQRGVLYANIVGTAGITLGQIVSLIVYFLRTGPVQMSDPLTTSIFLGSFCCAGTAFRDPDKRLVCVLAAWQQPKELSTMYPTVRG
ncbi:hypothetical protein HBA54_02185 [Pelagibius litoralis]|uniref:Uncharacterized protein n=1 Tax=Pelagibius litoralis TaxID=374515 RepID=A0A967CA29_9PROT|nr:hypothetical protein [Pelagibius litoralis]NIA67393.1 hypothetical protein [Pelagibius litoralis]